MAFPTGYTKYQDITIDHTKVPADLTDYVVYINLADLVKAGADIFDLCRSDGGDIRATKSDGTTELAVEVVSINTTSKIGEMYVKFSGTLSSTVDTVIRIYYNGTDTAPAVTDTYGRNAVWSGYRAVYHLDGLTDSTGNGYTLTNNNTVTLNASGKLGGSADFGSGNTNKTLSVASDLGMSLSSYTFDMWLNLYSVTTYGQGPWIINDATTRRVYGYYENSGGASMRFAHEGSASTQWNVPTSWSNSTWHKYTQTWDGTTGRGYTDGTFGQSSTPTGNTSITTSTFRLGAHQGDVAPTLYWKGLIDEVRVTDSTRSANWTTAEYNNQNSASTFYSTSNEQGGTADVSTTPSPLVATFSLPASTVTATQVVTVSPAVLSATFSIPAPAITGDSSVAPSPLVATFSLPTSNVITPDATISATVLVATFSLPTVTVTAELNTQIDPAVLSATFSLPTPTVTLGVAIEVYPDVLSATFSTPAPSVSVVSNMSVSPEALVATFSIPFAQVIADFWEDKFPVATDPFVDKVYNASDNWNDKY